MKMGFIEKATVIFTIIGFGLAILDVLERIF